MAIEIERKFLVTGKDWRTASPSRIVQGYLNRDRARTVRVRIAGAAAWLTIKGQNVGATRAEFEYAIPLADAEALLALCDGPLIDKQRHRIPLGEHVWEVDEFFGDNAGLIVAEIELRHEDEAFARPAWLGDEVSSDPRYYNSSLATHPYNTW